MGRDLYLTVILPMHNEEKRISQCVERVAEACSQITGSYEIIIAEDGSRDATPQLAAKLVRESPKHVRHQHSPHKLGRGAALTLALRSARGKYAAYMDADLSSSLKFLKRLIHGVEAGAAISTGSRLMPSSHTHRPALRDVFSRGYNTLVRTLLGSKLYDHQCGFKAFDLAQVLPLLDEVEDTHWFWDTEMLVRAQKKGLRVDEFPIVWTQNSPDSKVRLRSDVFYMGRKILDLKRKLMLRRSH